jgi:hypothetical protein
MTGLDICYFLRLPALELPPLGSQFPGERGINYNKPTHQRISPEKAAPYFGLSSIRSAANCLSAKPLTRHADLISVRSHQFGRQGNCTKPPGLEICPSNKYLAAAGPPRAVLPKRKLAICLALSFTNLTMFSHCAQSSPFLMRGILVCINSTHVAPMPSLNYSFLQEFSLASGREQSDVG